MRAFLFGAVVVVGAFFGIGVAAYFLISFVDRAQCSAMTDGMTIPHRWNGALAGCQVQTTEAGWIPLDQYYVRAPSR